MGARTSYSPGTFCWADVATTDLETSKAFYSGLFGWETEDRPVGETVYSVCTIGGARVAAIAGPSQADYWVNWVSTDDADASAARAAELGGTVVMGPFDVLEQGRMATITDPQGASFAVWQPRDTPGAGRVNEVGALTWNDLQTPDVDAAREFYSGLFGWTIEETEGSGGAYFTIRGADGLNGGMMPLPAEGVPPHWTPYFGVASMDQALEKAQQLGARPLTEPMPVPAGSFTPLADPQGAVFSIFAGELDP